MHRKRSSAPSAKQLLSLALALLSLGSCGVRRSNTSGEHQQAQQQFYGEEQRAAYTAPTRSDFLRQLERPAAYADVLRGALSAELKFGSKQFSTRVNATIVKGQCIYWSVIPFPLVEAARVWFTTEGITVLDRLGGRYAQVSFDQLSEHLGFPLSYQDVEHLLLGKLHKSQDGLKLEDFQARSDAKVYARFGNAKRVVEYQLTGLYQLDQASYYRSSIASQPLLTVDYTYADPNTLGRPETTVLKLQRATPATLSIDWSRLRPYEGALPDLSIKLKPSYQRIELSELLQMISKL